MIKQFETFESDNIYQSLFCNIFAPSGLKRISSSKAYQPVGKYYYTTVIAQNEIVRFSIA